MNRDIELRIKGHLYEITTLNDEVLGSRQGFPSSEEGYSKTLESVAECSETEIVDRVAKNIKERLQREEERPANQSVRREARMLLAEEGFVPGTYLNTA